MTANVNGDLINSSMVSVLTQTVGCQ